MLSHLDFDNFIWLYLIVYTNNVRRYIYHQPRNYLLVSTFIVKWCFPKIPNQEKASTSLARFLKGRLALTQDQNFVPLFVFTFLCIAYRLTFCAVITVLSEKSFESFFGGSSYMFLDNKTLFNPVLNLTIFRGTGPWKIPLKTFKNIEWMPPLKTTVDK